MRPKDTHEDPDLFRIPLDRIIDMQHELVILSGRVNWTALEKHFDTYYKDKRGRPGAPIRLMAGLHYLKHVFRKGDESVLHGFLENPYWQYFCGYDYFQNILPVDPSSLTRFRKRIGPEGRDYLLTEICRVAEAANLKSLTHRRGLAHLKKPGKTGTQVKSGPVQSPGTVDTQHAEDAVQ